MAWSDAAREAALAARRLKAKAKKSGYSDTGAWLAGSGSFHTAKSLARIAKSPLRKTKTGMHTLRFPAKLGETHNNLAPIPSATKLSAAKVRRINQMTANSKARLGIPVAYGTYFPGKK